MWEVIIPAVLSGAGVCAGFLESRSRLRARHKALAACGLRVVENAHFWSFWMDLKARDGPFEVRIRDPRRKNKGTQVVVTVPGAPPGFLGVRIRREADRPAGVREIEIGDWPFDSAFFIEGPLRLVCALLDNEMRGLLIGVNAEVGLEIFRGEIRTETYERGIHSALPILLDLARRLAQPLDVVGRLAENARRDPEPGVRLRNLLVLMRELPRDPEILEVIRGACTDVSPQVRLRAAMELGAEGWQVLLELAESAVDDACSAQAISSLGLELPFERTKTILSHSLRRRRIETARACLEVLGRLGSTETAIAQEAGHVLVRVLDRERSELAAAAAQALGTLGSPAAEPHLIDALRRSQEEVLVAAANALARVGSVEAVLPLKEAAERSSSDSQVLRATRQAIAEIQSRLAGASPGQLSLAGDEAGQLSLVNAEAGQVSLASDPAGQLSLPPEAAGQLSLGEDES